VVDISGSALRENVVGLLVKNPGPSEANGVLDSGYWSLTEVVYHEVRPVEERT
jgi:hypothetical protein